MFARRRSVLVFGSVVALGFTGILMGCGGKSSGSNSTPPVPAIQNINSSTLPSSPASLPVEINGTGFQNSPGQVTFSQGSITEVVTPSSGDWSDTGIVAVVPTGNGTTNFAVGTVSVSVETSGGTSNTVNLNLIKNLNFSVNHLSWTSSKVNSAVPSLPSPLTGMGAVAVAGSGTPPTTAYVVLAGGYNGSVSVNVPTVMSNQINSNGTLANPWNAIITHALPLPRAFAGMVEADPGNSLVPTDHRYIYVIGGQQLATATPGGTNTVFKASVDPSNGQVGIWTQLANSLPVALVGPGVTLFDGRIYVVGGLKTDGSPSSDVYSAQVNSDGTLGTWMKSPNSYPAKVDFATVLGYAGNLYVMNGDDLPSQVYSPTVADLGGIPDVNIAPVLFGAVGTWTPSPESTNQDRSKQIAWLEFGQIIDGEGTYNGAASTSNELEQTTVNTNGTLSIWTAVPAGNAPGANVYNAAAIVSPLLASGNVPRFLLFGGQSYTTSGVANAPVNTVYVNDNTTP